MPPLRGGGRGCLEWLTVGIGRLVSSLYGAHPRGDGPRVRARELGLPLGRFKPGKFNAITDVEGVLVGHSTLIRGEGPLRPGHGPVRTGVTAILPNQGNIFMERMTGGGFVLNGAGEVAGMTQLMEWGLIETPILLTNTMAVGAVSDGVARYLVDATPASVTSTMSSSPWWGSVTIPGSTTFPGATCARSMSSRPSTTPPLAPWPRGTWAAALAW